MKKVFLALAVAMVSLVSCSNDDDQKDVVDTTVHNASIDATSKTTWTYYSFDEKKAVGTGEETEADNEEWFGRKDWDFAVNRYKVRTNSGAATTVGSKGGVYICQDGIDFTTMTAIPSGATFVVDKAVTSSGMGGETTEVKSEAEVIVFKKNPDGSSVMPPVYLKAPAHIYRTADGTKAFKVQFTQYINAEGVSGHVKFDFAQIN